MKTREYDWFDTKNRKVLYGIQIKTDDGWICAGENGAPLLFETKEERDAKRKELQQKR